MSQLSTIDTDELYFPINSILGRYWTVDHKSNQLIYGKTKIKRNQRKIFVLYMLVTVHQRKYVLVDVPITTKD